MIGRMKPILNVLSAQDHTQYKAHYCGICAAAKQTFGRRASLGHSSELVFVSLILEGLSPESYEPGRAGCTALPLIPRKLAVGPSEHTMAIAGGLLATLQLDLKDAREDHERRIKRFLCRSMADQPGPIDPEQAWRQPFIQSALQNLPKDPVGELVAGVIGSVFHLAGYDERIVSDGTRIGHALGRLMNLSDALDDYFGDQASGRDNALRSEDGRLPDVDEVGRSLHEILDELDELIAGLPLHRNAELLSNLINVHARARAEAALARFRERAGLPPAPPFFALAVSLPEPVTAPPGSEPP